MRKTCLAVLSVVLFAFSGCGFTDTEDDSTTTQEQAQTPACEQVQKCLDACPESDQFACVEKCAENEGLETAQVRACGERCGTNFCGPDEYCCNESCGICAEQGSTCIQEYCG